MKTTYTTFQGARRAARIGGSRHYRPILRLLNGAATEHVFIVLENMQTELHAVDPETGRTDGKISFYDLTGRDPESD